MRSAVIVGGNGQIGRAAARRVTEAGFDVTVLSRSGTIPDGLAPSSAQVGASRPHRRG